MGAAKILEIQSNHTEAKILVFPFRGRFRDAGAISAGYTPLRLPGSVLPVFTQWLDEHRPERKQKVISAIQEVRGGQMNDARFGSRMRGEGAVADTLASLFRLCVRKEGLNQNEIELSTDHFQRPGDQLTLF